MADVVFIFGWIAGAIWASQKGDGLLREYEPWVMLFIAFLILAFWPAFIIAGNIECRKGKDTPDAD